MTATRLLTFVAKKGGMASTFLIAAALLTSSQAFSQKQTPKPAMHRCGTMEAIAHDLENDPAMRERLRLAQLEYNNYLNRTPGTLSVPTRPAALPDSVVIPVVVHVVLPNPWRITDDAIERFIERLNDDFSGRNADSTNGAAFYAVRGNSKLRFILARRDPAGNFTTGVVRRIGNVPIGTTNPQAIKNTATGGSTGWDVTKYYNMYVGDGGAAGLLGIAPAIGPGGAAGTTQADGVCVDYRAFADLCFSYPEFRLSRTTVHEIGHNFGLFHTFTGNCVGNDFGQLTTSFCLLPPDLLAPADDTPPLNGPTSGCPNPGTSNGCAPAQAKMFQHYMDYTDDACYSMFSKGSVRRMEWVLENCRAGYLTTLGGTYPENMPELDAAVHSVVSPGGNDFDNNTCTGVSYPAVTCPGAFIPRLRVANAGKTVMTSVTVTTTINGSNAQTQTFAVNIKTGKSAIVTLNAQEAIIGANALKFVVSTPNGGTDGNATNDELVVNFTVAPTLTLPYTESFQTTTFPPNNGSIVVNPDNARTWERSTAAGRPGSASMRVNGYNYAPDDNDNLGQVDIYRLPAINTSNFDTITIAFNVAYREYFGSDVPAPPRDSLKLMYSVDCGNSWRPTSYAKGGSSLSTVAGTTGDAFVPSDASQWRTEKVVITDLCNLGNNNVVFGFVHVNDFGNNVYVDSIDVRGTAAFARNASISSINEPAAALCTTSYTPALTLLNQGTDTLRTAKINFQLDNGPVTTINWTGALGKCDRTNIVLPTNTSTIGTHIIRAYVSEPNGGTDQFLANDSASRTFAIFGPQATPIFEGFESASFPPANWGVINVNGGTSWDSSARASRTGIRALSIDNKNIINVNGALDHFVSPIVINSNTFDSVFVDFDLAYRAGNQYPGSTRFPLDTLEIMATADCGLTFVPVWKKWGFELQTVNDPNYSTVSAFVPRLASEWRHERVYLSPSVGSGNFQLYFMSKGNKQNRIWLDNINISSIKLPQRLKDQGYLIYPNPFNTSFLIHHHAVEPPVNLQSIQVFNAAGQAVWENRYNGNADRRINIDLKNLAAGVYIVKMIYTNKTVVERIVKN